MRPARLIVPALVVLAGVLAYSSAFPEAFVHDAAFNVARDRRLDRSDEAIRALRRAGPEVSGQPLARARMALALLRRGDVAGARREVEALRSAAPGIAAQIGAFVESQAASPRP